MRALMDAPAAPVVANFAVTPHRSEAVETSATRFVVTLEMDLDAGPEVIAHPLVEEAWLAIRSDAGSAECTLGIERGRVRLRGVVASWDRARMDRLLAVMTALSSARARLIA